MIDYKTIAEKIRSCRAEKDISQEKLIALMQDRGAGISRNTLSALENGEQVKLSLESWQVLCELMGCDFGFLLGEHECKTKDVQAISDYTGLSEQAIIELNRRKRLMIGHALADIVSGVISDQEFLIQCFNWITAYYNLPGDAKENHFTVSGTSGHPLWYLDRQGIEQNITIGLQNCIYDFIKKNYFLK